MSTEMTSNIMTYVTDPPVYVIDNTFVPLDLSRAKLAVLHDAICVHPLVAA